MIRNLIRTAGLLMIAILISCNPHKDEIYERPGWLEGKLYTQLKAQTDVSMFIEAVELAGVSEIIEKSGYFTVFAPTDQAFLEFLNENPQYGGKLSSIPRDEIERIVRSHIIQNGWTLKQLQTLDILGWVDPRNPNYNEPRGFKRATILLDSLSRYWVYTSRNVDRIVDSEAQSNGYKTVVSTTRKFVPFFYPDYFRVKGYSSDDYEFYFGRPYDGGVYIAGSKITSNEIPAENGFIYLIDKVLDVRRNMEQIMKDEEEEGIYGDFLNLIYRYPRFNYNSEETNKQEGARQGLAVDSLYNLSYAPDLILNIHSENTGPFNLYTIREQNTIIAPTNDAIQRLYNDYVTINSGYPHWVNINDMPPEILRIIANSHMSSEVVYKREISEGFYNGESDIVHLNPSTIISKEYGSNGIVIGVNEAIIPRAFLSVTSPVYLRPGYSIFMYALENTGILPALKRADKNYTLITIPDFQLLEDSSLMLEWVDKELNNYRFNIYTRNENRIKRIRQDELTLMVMNQIVLGQPRQIARKEFMETVGGNYVVFDNVNQTISGGINSEYGFASDSAIQVSYQRLEEPTDNGQTISSNGWMMNGTVDIFNTLQSNFKKFLDLLDKAGLASKSNLNLPVLSDGEFYTILAPKDSALLAINADAIPLDSLRQILRFHFIKGKLVFTDGSSPSGEYETLKIDNAQSGEFVKVYEKMNLQTGPDYITILDNSLNPLYTIYEAGIKTNRFTYLRLLSIATASEFVEFDYRTNGVVHEINTLLIQ